MHSGEVFLFFNSAKSLFCSFLITDKAYSVVSAFNGTHLYAAPVSPESMNLYFMFFSTSSSSSFHHFLSDLKSFEYHIIEHIQ